MSIEQKCRDLLTVAIRDGLVKEGECSPEDLPSVGLVGMANLLIGGRIHIVKVRKLCLDREWQEAVSAAGPDTGSDQSIHKVGDLYLPTGTGVVEEEEHILLNYPNGGRGWGNALAWAAQFKLTPNDPRRVFAMAEQNPNLHHDLGMNTMRVVAPIACSFDRIRQACYAWWNDAKRGAILVWASSFDRASVWFSFRLPAQAGK